MGRGMEGLWRWGYVLKRVKGIELILNDNINVIDLREGGRSIKKKH